MIDRPLVIVGAPRSGTTLLFRCLAVHPRLWHLATESHSVLEGPLRPDRTGADSHRCGAEMFDPSLGRRLRARFDRSAINLNRFLPDPGPVFGADGRAGRALYRALCAVLGPPSRIGRPDAIRFLEKTPRNSLRVPFLDRLFPDARFLWLCRDPLDTIDSLVAGWRAGGRWSPLPRPRFARAGYRLPAGFRLRERDVDYWRFALVPGWRNLSGARIADVAAWQYLQCVRYAGRDLLEIPEERVRRIRFEDFLDAPLKRLREIEAWAELSPADVTRRFARSLPSVNALDGDGRGTAPGELRYGEEVRAAVRRLPELEEWAVRLGYSLLDRLDG